MKKLAVLVFALGALAAYGQTNRANTTLQSPSLHTPPPSNLGHLIKPNEIVHGNVAYSGLAVQAYKAHNPLQLINPLAPPQYGSAQMNLDYNPTTGRSFGLKIFSIRF